MTELAYSKLKYGLFSRVIICHDRSAQNRQNLWHFCARNVPRSRTQAPRRRRVCRISLTPGKRRCRVLDAPWCHHVET